MSLQSPFKLLEISIISAQDLPPVSKLLRTFAVAYDRPDHKLTSGVDHHGHTNPTWNHKVVFHVEDKFLKDESYGITFEIYNVAWLRDLPMGTARLLINHLSPPLQTNHTVRRVALQICRPSGHLQGTLNVGVQLLENACGTCVPTMRNVERLADLDQYGNPHQDEEDWKKHEKDLAGSESVMMSRNGNASPPICERENVKEHRPEPEPEPVVSETSYGSRFSAMRPLPSEVAADMEKGTEYRSSVFERWSEPSNNSEDHRFMRSKSVRLGTDERNIRLRTDLKKSGSRRRGRSDKKKGLLSCFGNAYGFQFSFICGSKTKKMKKNRNVEHDNVHLMSLPQENLRTFYV